MFIRRSSSMLSSVLTGPRWMRSSAYSRCSTCKSCWLVTSTRPPPAAGSTFHSTAEPKPASSTKNVHSVLCESHRRMANIAALMSFSKPTTTFGQCTRNSRTSCCVSTTSELACSHAWSPPRPRISGRWATSAMTASLPTPGAPCTSTREPAAVIIEVNLSTVACRPTISLTRAAGTVIRADGRSRSSVTAVGASTVGGASHSTYPSDVCTVASLSVTAFILAYISA
mmetsp:Transcript_12050/g.36300  ORF Transcript_12050/g.36300 Transcript_12050/m.36300 type:complete len:227 (+) Transcript_12050:1155-1835(+)